MMSEPKGRGVSRAGGTGMERRPGPGAPCAPKTP